MIWHIRKISPAQGPSYVVGRIADLPDEAAATLTVEHSTGSFSVSTGSISLTTGAFFWRRGTFCFRSDQIEPRLLTLDYRTRSGHEGRGTRTIDLAALPPEADAKLDPAPWLDRQAALAAKGGSFRDLWVNVHKGLGTWFEPFVIAGLRAALPRSVADAVKDDVEAYARCFDTLCDLLNYDDECRALCDRDEHVNGETFWAMVNRGHLAYRKEDRTAVDAFYAKAAALSAPFNVIHFNRGTRSWRDKDYTEAVNARALDAGLARILKGPIETALPHDGDIVHIVGCDTAYFERYLPFMLNAHLNENDGCAVLHFHVSNPSDHTRSLLATLSRSGIINLNYSFDTPYSEFLRPEYYTCVRFLFAPLIDKYKQKKIFITDVDISLSTTWARLLDLVGDSIAGFRFNGVMSSIFDYAGYYGPPWSVNAQTSYYSQAPQARHLLEFQSKYIQSMIVDLSTNSKASFWTIDQVAIRLGLDRHFDKALAPRIVNLSLHPLMARAPKDSSALRMQVETRSERGRRLSALIASNTP